VPSVKEVLAQLKIETARAEKLCNPAAGKVLVRVSADLIFHRDALNALTGTSGSVQESKASGLAYPAFKELTGTREYAIPSLEYLAGRGRHAAQGMSVLSCRADCRQSLLSAGDCARLKERE